MGTHPIFESDFDCLTENKMERLAGVKLVKDVVKSVTKETAEPIKTKIRGRIPTWIKGSMLRNGAAQWDLGEDTVHHWFDGHALLHKFEIADGEVTYMNKFLQSGVYEKNSKYERWIHGGFGTPAKYSDPCKTLFERFTSYFLPPKKNEADNCNVNIWPIGEKLYAFTETTRIREVDPETLESPSKLDVCDYVTIHTETAHPHTDQNGVYYNMGSTFGKNAFYNIIRMDPNKAADSDIWKHAEIVARIPAENAREPAYYHSYGMTLNHVLFLEMPYRFNLFKMLTAKLFGTPPAASLVYHSDKNSIIKVANIKTGTVLPIRIETKGMGVFHFGNAFEVEVDGTTYVIWDTCPNYDSNGATHLYNIETLRSRTVQQIKDAFVEAGENEAKRFVFPLSIPAESKPGDDINSRLEGVFDTECQAILKEDGTVWLEGESLFDNSDCKSGFFGFEFPRYNYALNGQKYRYLYGCGFGQMLPDKLCKIDTKTKQMKIWSEDDIYPSEPVFVQDPASTDIAGADEDKGVILSVCVSTKPNVPIFLLILDAATFEEIGRAQTDICSLPYGFHHTFLPQTK